MGHDYDLITVGGGLAGAALARALAEQGARVLVLERETVFRDRIRGELLQPWGVAEACALGIHDLLKQTCGHEARFRFVQVFGAQPAQPRDLVATTPQRSGSLHFPHPQMQEVVLEAAARAGAHVRRGARVVAVSPGSPPSVSVQSEQGNGSYTARLVVGADGRTSACRSWAGFTVNRDPDRMVIAGLLLAGVKVPTDTFHMYVDSARGAVAFVIPLGATLSRCYFSRYQQGDIRRFSGPKAVPGFLESCVLAGAPAEWLNGAQPAGPLASFDCAETWVSHPYQAGVALVGDAAATSDPTFGCGLSLTLRDVRVLSRCLLDSSDWEAAAHAYAAEHDRYFDALHRVFEWLMQLLYEPGPQAAARRRRAWARMADNPTRMPDISGLGPEAPSDEAAYRDLFGDES